MTIATVLARLEISPNSIETEIVFPCTALKYSLKIKISHVMVLIPRDCVCAPQYPHNT